MSGISEQLLLIDAPLPNIVVHSITTSIQCQQLLLCELLEEDKKWECDVNDVYTFMINEIFKIRIAESLQNLAKSAENPFTYYQLD